MHAQPYQVICPTDVIYQLSLNIKGNCHDWSQSNTEDKAKDINKKIIEKINAQCGDNTTDVENGFEIDKHAYKCRNAHDDHVVYNVHLLETPNANVIKLVECMDSWVKLPYPTVPTIVVVKVEYAINKDCSRVLMDSDFICSWSPPKLDAGSEAAIALGIILFLFIIGAIIVGVIVKKR